MGHYSFKSNDASDTKTLIPLEKVHAQHAIQEVNSDKHKQNDTQEHLSPSTATYDSLPGPYEEYSLQYPMESLGQPRTYQRLSTSTVPGRFFVPRGWKLGTAIAAILTLVILIGNIVLTAVFTSEVRHMGYKGGIAPIRTGDCAEMKRLSVAIHLIINVASTLLLGATNYCMQTVSAPTRQDVKKAHASGKSLVIGIPSLRNLSHIGKKRLFVWICLGFSSLPLHFIYNSSFFISTTNNLYQVWVVDESFTHGASVNRSAVTRRQAQLIPSNMEALQNELVSTNNYQRLENKECLQAYGKPLVEDRGNVILVLDQRLNCSHIRDLNDYVCLDETPQPLYAMLNYTTRVTSYQGNANWNYWLCSENDVSGGSFGSGSACRSGAWKNFLDVLPWTFYKTKVSYCLSEKLEDQCQVKVALHLLAIVVVFNAIKFFLMVLIASSSLVPQEPLVTIGDAAASFIESPDPATKGMCLMGEREFQHLKKSYGRTSYGIIQDIQPTPYTPEKKRWSSAVRNSKWWTASAVCVLVGFLVFALADLGARYRAADPESILDLGLGLVTPYNLIKWGGSQTGEGSVILAVLVSNLPQVLLSLLYMVINNLITTMTSAAEWAKYSWGTHQPLRVSFPQGCQRSTYFLQLPYRFSIPMLLLSILMHFFVSMSIFLAQIREKFRWSLEDYADMADDVLDRKNQILTTCAYSPLGIIITISIIALMYGCAVLMGRLKLSGDVAIAGNCSMAIAAACHTLEGTSSLEPVKWGVVLPPTIDNGDVGHCSFSNSNVCSLKPGKLYA